ncbi:MAG: NAD-dependent epimerase/dehydratase family protein [Prevotella sp.]|jgi:UDP-glucuronate 4-epimerase
MKVLVTGAAGFIGHALVKLLLKQGLEVVGIDNFTDYYNVNLKHARLADLGIDDSHRRVGNFHFEPIDITDTEAINQLFAEEHFTHVCNLAGQPGVRYSLDHPMSYVQANVVGFVNLLEACRNHGLPRLVYASSSSVYGMQDHVPFHETDRTDHPVSLYAATKKSDEVMAYAYSKLFKLQTVGLRFFTVYGPWGRPDMAPIKFMKAIIGGEEIQVYNHGDMLRDFTYIDDIVEGVSRVLRGNDQQEVPARIYNIGNSEPVRLLDFIHCIEKVTGKQAHMQMVGMQPGDVTRTYADSAALLHDYDYRPDTDITTGITRLYEWLQQHQELI